MKIYENYDIKKLSNIKIGGVAKKIIYIEDINELQTLDLGKYFIIGNGSNILFNNRKYLETFISFKHMKNIKLINESTIEVSSGVLLSSLLQFMAQNNLTGLEEMIGVPATIGGLIYMNAGSNKIAISDFLEKVTIFKNNKLIEIKKKDLIFSYRKSQFMKNKDIIISAVFKFDKGYNFAKAIEYSRVKTIKQPLNYPNLGSIFKNPKGYFAWKLIDECGLRGTIVGGAQISTKHSNFIVNIGNAKFQDVVDLIQKVKAAVKENFNIKLHEEIKIME